jgi:hypothetical protein
VSAAKKRTKRRASAPKAEAPPRALWSDVSRRRLGLKAIYPMRPRDLYTVPLADLLLYGCAGQTSDAPVLDIIKSVADEIELLALHFRGRRRRPHAPEPPAYRALHALARRARVAAMLHVRVAEVLWSERGERTGR